MNGKTRIFPNNIIVKTISQKLATQLFNLASKAPLAFDNTDTDRTNIEVAMLGPGRVNRARLHIKTNTRDAITVFTLRVNNVDTGITITVPALSETDIVSVGVPVPFLNGDLLFWDIPASGTTGSIVCNGSTEISYDN